MQSLSVNGPKDLKSYRKRVNSDKFRRGGTSALQIIWTACLYSDGDELNAADCIASLLKWLHLSLSEIMPVRKLSVKVGSVK